MPVPPFRKHVRGKRSNASGSWGRIENSASPFSMEVRPGLGIVGMELKALQELARALSNLKALPSDQLAPDDRLGSDGATTRLLMKMQTGLRLAKITGLRDHGLTETG